MGGEGVLTTIPLALDTGEREGLRRSAGILREAIGRAFGLPTTILVDPHGCEIGSIAGPAEWASDDAVKLIKAALGKS